MDYFSVKYITWAVVLGAISAASLPLGSWIGLRLTPRPSLISVLAAFGAGALIAALSVELVAPTVMAIGDIENEGSHDNPVMGFYSLIFGAICGGILFVLLDQVVNAKGGFLRKKATSIAYFGLAEKKRKKKIIQLLSKFTLFQQLPAEYIESLLTKVQIEFFGNNETIFKQGEDVNRLLLLSEGEVEIIRDGKILEMNVTEREVIGLIPLLANQPSPAKIQTKGKASALVLTKKDFNQLRNLYPEFDIACRKLTEDRLGTIEKHITAESLQSFEWTKNAVHALNEGVTIPDIQHLKKAKEEHSGAALAIWLGILLDGIPESLVIGGGLLIALKAHFEMGNELVFLNVVPYTLIAGLFLSNFPEALSSSTNMKLQGWGKGKIFLMWFSLMVITGIGSGLGYILADTLRHTQLIFLEGLAAGAMLTMIAAAMIPEAVHSSKANAVGISTLIGFIAAISFKLLE